MTSGNHKCTLRCPCDKARTRRNAYSREWSRAKRAAMTDEQRANERERRRHSDWAKRNGIASKEHRPDPSVCAICKVPVLTHPMKWCR